ncbi:unnamed protein product, partial [Ectocarpus sp. 12 AP-2014]
SFKLQDIYVPLGAPSLLGHLVGHLKTCFGGRRNDSGDVTGVCSKTRRGVRVDRPFRCAILYYKTVALVVQPTTSKILRLQCSVGSSRFGEASSLGTGLKQALVREHP